MEKSKVESDVVWGNVLDAAPAADTSTKPSAYVKIDPNDPKYEKYMHCSHVFIYTRTKSMSLNMYDRKAIVLMQMRCDGFLGFPGGVVDAGETPVQALNRELREESGWFEDQGPVTQDNHLFTHVNEERQMVLHFYAIEVTDEKISEIEANTLQAVEYGEEVLGSCRVPLYTMNDNYSGFPSFLRNNFVGNAKVQLIEALVNLNFLTAENVLKALRSKPLPVS